MDTFDAPELAPVRGAFLDGAYFVYGHTMMQRALRLGYSGWASAHFPGRHERNAFYTRLGRQTPPGSTSLSRLKDFTPESLPQDFLSTTSQ